MSRAFIALGSNLGNRQKNIKEALTLIEENSITILRHSTTIETDPVGGPVQGKFLNAVIEIETKLSASELLKTLLSIENKMGRKRSVLNAPRPIDLDILLYDNISINTRDLIIPHPRMLKRDFVMIPLKEIAPQIVKDLLNENH